MVSNGLYWEKIYKEKKIENMHWYYPDLDPDLKKALEEMNIGSGHILDLCTGPGTQAIALAKIGFKVTATDIAAEAIAKAKMKSKQQGLDILRTIN